MASCAETLANPAKPTDPNGFSGNSWPQMCKSSKTSAHFFGIGDWGGDHTTGNTWDNPGHAQYHGGFENGPDDHGQYYVARQMKDLAGKSDTEPDFVINAGDNLYPGGYDTHCGTSTGNDPSGIFKQMFEDMYGGPGMDAKPWLGVLGNHDYGGISMHQAWDELIFHTWESPTWRTPAPYWSQRVQYRDFAVQFIFLDSNYNDAGADPAHKICQGGGECWGLNDGSCVQWFQDQWIAGLKMAEDVLSNSTAEWNIVVTHYPATAVTPGIQHLHDNYGIDVLFTGHNHMQTLTQLENGMVHIVSGGGGGITTDSGVVDKSRGNDDALGFVDFEISRTKLKINMHTWGGCTSCDATEGPAAQVIRNTTTISPHGPRHTTTPPTRSTSNLLLV